MASDDSQAFDLVGSYAPVDHALVQRFELESQIPLPASYERFLVGSNGGRPSGARVLAVPGWPHKATVLSYFFGLYARDAYDLERNILSYRGRLPDDCIPIADDVAGNLFCVEVHGGDRGAIYFWDHEHESDFPENRKNMYRVADDVFDLLRQLNSDDVKPPVDGKGFGRTST